MTGILPGDYLLAMFGLKKGVLIDQAGMAVLGSVTVKVLLSFSMLLTEMFPPWACMIARAQLRPRPVPGCDRLRSHR